MHTVLCRLPHRSAAVRVVVRMQSACGVAVAVRFPPILHLPGLRPHIEGAEGATGLHIMVAPGFVHIDEVSDGLAALGAHTADPLPMLEVRGSRSCGCGR